MDKLKDLAKMFNIYADLDRPRPWIVKDPGLGYKDYCNKDYFDALRYSAEYLGKWKGEQKMGTSLDSVVNGKLYYRNEDGNFVEIMTVTDIETNDDLRYMNTRIKVEGHTGSEAETIEVNNRRMLGPISEKYSLEDHVYFMIFDETTFSIKINRNTYNYSSPYRVTIYDAGHILWTMAYQTWHDLECTFLYEIGAVLNADFSPITVGSGFPSMMKNAKRVVKYCYSDCDNERRELEREKNKLKTFLNCIYSTAAMKGTPMNVSTNIDKVIFDDPATVILWKDGTKTVVHTQDDEPYDKEKGFAMAVCKKIFGNERDYYHVFKRWFRKGEDRSIKRLIEKLGNNGSREEREETE